MKVKGFIFICSFFVNILYVQSIFFLYIYLYKFDNLLFITKYISIQRESEKLSDNWFIVTKY